jgi:hypothetical protein
MITGCRYAPFLRADDARASLPLLELQNVNAPRASVPPTDAGTTPTSPPSMTHHRSLMDTCSVDAPVE